MTKEILFATGNQGKAKELKEAFKRAGVDVEIKTNADLDNPKVEEHLKQMPRLKLMS